MSKPGDRKAGGFRRFCGRCASRLTASPVAAAAFQVRSRNLVEHAAAEVLVVSPCSGHGFKFCSVIGEIVADLVTRDRTAHDIAAFRLSRFQASQGDAGPE